MSGERFTVDPAFRAFMHDLRVSPRAVLRRAGVPDGLFRRGPVRLTPDEYYRLWTALQDEAGDRNLILDVGEAISAETFSPPILAALCSPDLSVAARRIAEFKPLIGPLRLVVDDDDSELTISYRWPGTNDPPTLLALSELVFWVALARIGTRHRIRPSRLTAPSNPQTDGELEKYLGGRVTRSPVHSVAFTHTDARRAFLTENDTMWRFMAPELRRRLSDLEAGASTADQVRAALIEMLPAGDSSMATVTTKLAISARTLQRQLTHEGTTYKQVLATTREELARRYLTRDDLRTADIAYLLGYDDTNSFYRAFRTWTGTTPDAARTPT
ncbi:AraC family transcriptional regulator [Rhodococcus triatomae]|nr:AraC family transcriptional regulator [Rhodococcus triatomae BKS 15-14]